MATYIFTAPGQTVHAGQPGQVDNVVGLATGNDTVILGYGQVNFDPSFNAGGDHIYFPGNAWDYNVGIAGSQITLSNSLGTSAILPLGTSGTSLYFSGGARSLYISGSSVVVGGQVVSSGYILEGSGSNDTIVGTSGNNFLSGRGGSDTLTGGSGVDTFLIRHNESIGTNAGGVKAYDRITDFADGVDKLRILDTGGNLISMTNVSSAGGAASENAVVDDVETLLGVSFGTADAFTFTAAGIGVGVLADSNNNSVIDTSDTFVWIATPGAVVTAADFA